ncbi:MAG: bifunctional RNase H/acid phosphatase [Aeromicrobium sp.]|uniref:bifunctional RNase H/acid phosphatase n=1 Tax=Aeromicrobium sp. TaxID=1871063 RepID=UPI00261DFF6A|nr:bifunctional RNase H/acid phosphatase [Aeromicrobium sp.]MDF1703584.1 bifunctional RNase H/acid phosphatase [Aeromicrobium sp.]
MTRFVLEADGGSRGNPGPAAYGALVRDGATGAVIASCGATIGQATNNVAEYRGLIGALELAREHAPGEAVEVRMDSKLVIEQMAGRWRIKDPGLRELADRAAALVPEQVTWTWVPRAQNAAADALANEALDEQLRTGRPAVVGVVTGAVDDELPSPHDVAEASHAAPSTSIGAGWRGRLDSDPTVLVLLRHGVTASTVRRLFCGSGGSDPELVEEGREQASRAAAWIARHHQVDAVVASPLRRTRETAGFVARRFGLDVTLEPGVAETAFGAWDGHTFAEIMEQRPEEMSAWLGSTAVAPPGGETFDAVDERVSRARERLVTEYAGKTVVVVSHVTPIKMMVREALGAPMSAVHTLELAPASISTIVWWPDALPSVRNFSLVPE